MYLSGAITGTNDYLVRFSLLEGKLKSDGYEVINPAAVNARLPNSLTWDEYLSIDLAMLDVADAIYLMDGWRNSRGARAEAEHAMRSGKAIMMQEAGD